MKDNKSESEGSNKDNNEKTEKMDETKPEKENDEEKTEKNEQINEEEEKNEEEKNEEKEEEKNEEKKESDDFNEILEQKINNKESDNEKENINEDKSNNKLNINESFPKEENDNNDNVNKTKFSISMNESFPKPNIDNYDIGNKNKFSVNLNETFPNAENNNKDVIDIHRISVNLEANRSFKEINKSIEQSHNNNQNENSEKENEDENNMQEAFDHNFYGEGDGSFNNISHDFRNSSVNNTRNSNANNTNNNIDQNNLRYPSFGSNFTNDYNNKNPYDYNNNNNLNNINNFNNNNFNNNNNSNENNNNKNQNNNNISDENLLKSNPYNNNNNNNINIKKNDNYQNNDSNVNVYTTNTNFPIANYNNDNFAALNNYNNYNNNNNISHLTDIEEHPDYDQHYEIYKEEPEDTDGQDIFTGKGEDSHITASVQIANAIMGAGILSIPIIMRYLGYILGTLFITILAILTYYSVYLLLRCHEITGKSGYSMFGKVTLGNFGTMFVKIIFIINNFGLCCAYFRIFGEVMQIIIQAFVSPNSFLVTNWHNMLYILIVGLIMCCFIFQKNISDIKSTAYFGVVTVIVFILLLIILLIYKTVKNDLPQESTLTFCKTNATFLEAFHAIPTVFLSFSFQFNLFPIYYSLQNRKKEVMMEASLYAIIFCLVIFLLAGIFGFTMYGLNMNDTLLNEFDKDMVKYRNNGFFIKLLLICICVTFVISCLTSFPSLFISFRENFYNAVIYSKKNCCKDDEVVIQENENERKEITVETSAGQFIAVCLYLLIIILTILIEKLKIILRVVGAISGSFISFILPCLFYMLICKMSRKNESLVIPFIILTIGLLITLLSVALSFIDA